VSGVDALYLSARAPLPSPFVARLEESRQWATELRRAAPCQLGELWFGMAPYGWGKYRYCLDHPMARLGFTESRHLPTVRVQPRAEFLHAVGPAGVLDALRELLEPELGELRFSVSRLDLFVDVQGWPLALDDAPRFVCRADARRTYEVDGRLTGFEFGSRKSKGLCARIYDKTADIETKGTTWWHEVWDDRFVEDLVVHRVEFEIGRQGLVDFGLDSPAEALEAMGDLWRYATDEWLTFRSPTADRTRARWPIAPEWHAVQDATLRHRSVGLARLHETKRRTSIDRLLPGLNGYLVSLAAVVGTEGIDDTLGAVGHHLQNYETASRTAFSDRVAQRRRELELR
jgi:hypothetical protein